LDFFLEALPSFLLEKDCVEILMLILEDGCSFELFKDLGDRAEYFD